MITHQDVITARYGDLFHGLSADRTKLIRVRVTGQCKLWKTRPNEFRLPVAHGLYDCGYITHNDLDRWTKGDLPAKTTTKTNT